jgi:RHS repeat-associated protein
MQNAVVATTEVPMAATQTYGTFHWNGTDANGRLVPGAVPVTIASTDIVCNPVGSTPCTEYGGAEHTVLLGTWQARVLGLGGWGISAHHFYDAARKKVYLGAGGTRAAEALPIQLSASGAVSTIDPAVQTLTHSLVTSADGAEAYIFDLTGRHLETRSTTSGTALFTFSYGQDFELDTITDAFQNVTRVVRVSPTQVRIVAPHGQMTTLTLDAQGWLTAIQDPNGGRYAMTYAGPDGLLASFQRPSGRRATFTYDPQGYLIEDANNGGASLTFDLLERSPHAHRVQMTSAEGHVETYATTTFPADNGFQRTESIAGIGTQHVELFPQAYRRVTTPGGLSSYQSLGEDPRFGWLSPVMTSSQIRNALSGQVLTQSFATSSAVFDATDLLRLHAAETTHTIDAKPWTTSYDGTTRTTTLRSPLGRVTQVTRNDADQMTAIQAGTLLPVTVHYDARGRVQSLRQGARTQTFAYNAQGFLKSRTDALGHVSSYTYDANGQVVTAKRPDGRVVRFTYDADGQLLSLTPVSQPAHAFTVNLLGLTESYLPPVVGGQTLETTYAYNRDRQLTRITTPDGTPIDFTYGAGRLLSAVDTSEGTFAYSYLAGGRLAQVTSPQGVQSTLGYAAERLTSQDTLFDTYAAHVTYAYESRHVKSLSIAGATGQPASVTYTLDDDDLVVQAGALQIARDPSAGSVVAQTLGAVVEQYTYDPSFGELSSIQAAASVAGSTQPLFSEALTRDALGRITAKTETLPTGVTTYGYAYDPVGRLTDVTVNGVLARHYGYDGNHNRTLVQEGTRRVRGTYDEQDRLVQYGGKTYAYTGNGDRMLRTLANGLTAEYRYDAFGALLHVTTQSKDAQGHVRTKVVEYINDGFGRRLIKKVDGAPTRQYVWDAGQRLIVELNQQGAVRSHFVYATRSHVPDYLVRAGVTYKIITDHLGSVRLVVDAQDGTVAQALTYDEFGNVLSDSQPGFQPFGFAGGLYDPATQFVRFGARDYDPETGRWTSKDPIGFAGGDTNLYGYSVNDPVNRIDPDGLDSFIISNMHEYLVVSDPDSPGNFIVFDFAPKGGIEQGIKITSAVEARVREQTMTAQEVANLGLLKLSKRKQSAAEDRATIRRARELMELANKGQLKYNALFLGQDTLNCIGFTRAAQ